ncbi:MAG: glycosyltransferase family 4 protein [Chloroflexi bacterium]|nr:glycosyltransferase family 4 protein [Chloroflexota bacterium]
MRVLLLTTSFPPAVNSAARLFYELAQGLSRRGHHVTVLTSIPDRYVAERKPWYRRRPYTRESVNGIRTHRVAGLPIPKGIPLLRGVEHFLVAYTYLLVGLLLGRHRAVIVYSPPLPLGLTGYLLSRLWRGPLVLNIQDLYPQTAIDLGLLRSRILIRISRRLERFLYRRAEAITVHSPGNREYVVGHGAPQNRVHVVPNWVDLEALRPGSRDGAFRATHQLGNAFLVSYGGVMGFAQGMEDVVEAASRLRDYPDVLFLLVGEGVARSALERRVRELGLANVRFMDTQPPETYAQLLSASDASLVTLRKELRTPVVPGKLQAIMAAGRPAICSVPSDSDAARLVQEAGCGVWVEAGCPDRLAEAVLSLHSDRALAEAMGRRGRAYAEAHFDQEGCIEQYHQMLTGCRKQRDSRREHAKLP